MSAEGSRRRQAAGIDNLLAFVKEARGFDFTGYKRSSIERRVVKRMSEVHSETYEDYIDYLQLHAGEFAQLFNTLLINVTSFFRDPQAWEYLADHLIPQLVAKRGAEAPLRIWCAGCASGEEAYTVAMCIARAVGDDAFRDNVKIYATDIDEAALDTARAGAYTPRQIEPVPGPALEHYFERTDQRYVFRKDLRRSVIFGRNDLVQDAPISRIDLLVCRNALMYFTAEAQAQILRRFHFAVDPDGYLMLGKSEMLITHSDLFTPVELKQRVFRKVMRPTLKDRVHALTLEPGNGAVTTVAADLREAAFDSGTAAQVVVDAEGTIMMLNAVARRAFGMAPHDVGRPIQDLELSYRPLELRGHLDAMQRELKPIDVKGVRWVVGERERLVDVRLMPLATDSEWLGASISYLDVTDEKELDEQLARSKQELEQAYEELNSTVEELETTNEELQSTNEELETTNEELQSTNEELETMNEELQSTNEELETMNEELRNRTVELNDMNVFLEAILTTIGYAVVVVDRTQHVKIWNSQARELWGLASDEVENQHLFSLDIGLPVEKLRSALRKLLGGKSEREEVLLDATNRRGKPFQCRVTALALGTQNADGVSGAIIMMEAASGG
ncbi:MAG TPA: CheR family methyltransferase [Solirubrobacteraceae bacterium]|jgi:two-component system CheB/CheR fusion protein